MTATAQPVTAAGTTPTGKDTVQRINMEIGPDPKIKAPNIEEINATTTSVKGSEDIRINSAMRCKTEMKEPEISGLPHKAEVRNEVSGLRINKYCPTITHLFYADDSLLFFKTTNKECRNIKNILGIYEAASGQTINFYKSMFMVSPNTSPEMKTTIRDIIRVPFTDSLGQYPGLPSQNARNKKEIFNNIKDQVWRTLQG